MDYFVRRRKKCILAVKPTATGILLIEMIKSNNCIPIVAKKMLKKQVAFQFSSNETRLWMPMFFDKNKIEIIP